MRTLIARLRGIWARHRSLFWFLHSIWALATGVVVIILARERYGFVPWVVVFLGLTWASTMYFGRRSAMALREGDAAAPVPPDAPTGDSAPPMAEELSGYVTRIMYQETLFFLLPFYAYSTVIGSANIVFLGLLGVLAVVSCLDMLFDRWIRVSPVFGLVFFAAVSFAGMNLVFPMLLALPTRWATPIAGVLAVGAAVPLALRATRGASGHHLRLGLAAAAIVALAVGVPRLVPPVPLRMQDVVFSSGIQREGLVVADTLPEQVSLASVSDGVVVLARVFAPSAMPARVFIEWRRDGTVVRQTDPIELTAHDVGFRVWDALRPGPEGMQPGTYRVVFRAWGQRVFGVAEVVLQ